MRLTARQFWLLALVGLLAALVATLAYRQLRVVASTQYYGTPLDEPLLVAPFELTDAEGNRVTLQSWQGEVQLVFFGFTRCPDVCPLTLGRLAKVYKDMGRPDDLQVVMISVDPAYDTPQRTQAYASAFDPSFVGLSGSASDLAKAARTFFIGYQGLEGNDFLHTDTVALLDRRGRMRLVYGQDRVARLSEDLPKILASRNF